MGNRDFLAPNRTSGEHSSSQKRIQDSDGPPHAHLPPLPTDFHLLHISPSHLLSSISSFLITQGQALTWTKQQILKGASLTSVLIPSKPFSTIQLDSPFGNKQKFDHVTPTLIL